MKKCIAASLVFIGLTVALTTLCLSSLGCQQGPPRATSRREPVPQAPSATETQTAPQRRAEAAATQGELRGRYDADREQGIDELLGRAKTYWKQQQYEAALGQLQALLAIDPLNSEALALQQMVQDMIYLRGQLQREQQLSVRQPAEKLQGIDEANVPYADEFTYPGDWRGIVQGPSSTPASTMQPGQNGMAGSGMGGFGGMMGGMGGMRSGMRGGMGGLPMAVPEAESPAARILAESPTARILAELATVREDEIWVVARERPEGPPAPGPEYDTPGSGAMLAQIQEKKVPLPLKHTDVKGKVSGYIATVEVVQQFQNPFSEKIEAVYVFPLPENAAVN